MDLSPGGDLDRCRALAVWVRFTGAGASDPLRRRRWASDPRRPAVHLLRFAFDVGWRRGYLIPSYVFFLIYYIHISTTGIS